MLAKAAIAAIRLYQLTLSRILPSACRFTLSCSQYALEAYRKHGFVRGTGLSVWRVLRCNPFNKGGFDPVP